MRCAILGSGTGVKYKKVTVTTYKADTGMPGSGEWEFIIPALGFAPSFVYIIARRSVNESFYDICMNAWDYINGVVTRVGARNGGAQKNSIPVSAQTLASASTTRNYWNTFGSDSFYENCPIDIYAWKV